MPILVDTGAVELLRRGNRQAEALVLRHYPPIICAHVVGEFLFGQAHSGVSAATYQLAREFLSSFEILQPSAETAAVYARLRADLSARGLRLPDPDYWIAAHAIEGRLPLVTTDGDFRQLPDLAVYLISP